MFSCPLGFVNDIFLAGREHFLLDLIFSPRKQSIIYIITIDAAGVLHIFPAREITTATTEGRMMPIREVKYS